MIVRVYITGSPAQGYMVWAKSTERDSLIGYYEDWHEARLVEKACAKLLETMEK